MGYSELVKGFISFYMIKILNVTHLCYPARRAITVCSGRDDQCKTCDFTILFHSDNGECNCISLPIRVYRQFNLPRQHSAGTKPRYILAQDCVAVTFDNDVFNLTDVAPSGSATPFSRLDAVSTLVPSCSQPRLSVTR